MQSIQWRYYPLAAQHPVTHSFIESLAKRRRRPKTIDAYARNLNDFLAFSQHHTFDVVEATYEQIENYIDDLYSRTLPRRGTNIRPLNERSLADATIRQRLVTVRCFYEFCLERDLRQQARNPVPRGSYGPKPKRGVIPFTESIPWIPTDDIWIRIVADVEQHEPLRNHTMFMLAFDAGLRRQEVITVCLSDINWADGMVTIRPEHAKSRYPRSVPFSLATEALLKTYVQTVRQTILEGWGGDPGGPIFLSESHRNSGEPLRIGAFNDIVDRIRTRLHLPQLHPHSLRHLRCTILKRCGLSLQEIALFAGHRSFTTTAKYIHLDSTELGKRIRTVTASFDARMQRLILEARHDHEL